MKLYGIRNCDTVRKARKFLDKAGVAYEFVDFDVTPPDETLIRRWLEHIDVSALFNTRSTAYRTLGLKAKIANDDDRIAWMAKENRLVKRPVLDTGDDVIVGFKEEIYQSLV